MARNSAIVAPMLGGTVLPDRRVRPRMTEKFICAFVPSSSYSFRPLARADLPLLRRWLKTPEVTRWWGDPVRELALIEDDLAGGAMTQWIVSFEETPFAYAQAYEVHAWPQPHLAHLPPGTMAIDAFVGEPDRLGHGHGARFLRELARRMIEAGAPLVVMDPDRDNRRARRAYRKAGFRGEAVVETATGAVVLMTFAEAANAKTRSTITSTRPRKPRA
jgi:aminoglycoside 6'-N-acetyltransferase